MKLDFCVSHNYTQRDLLQPPSSSPLPPSSPLPSLLLLLLLLLLLHHYDSVEIPHKTRYKQKRNEILENITHFIHLSLKNTILGVLHNISENNKLYM
jgi:hypothetical protein